MHQVNKVSQHHVSQHQGLFDACPASSSSVAFVCWPHGVSSYSCTALYLAKGTRDLLCRFLKLVLCVIPISLVFCSTNFSCLSLYNLWLFLLSSESLSCFPWDTPSVLIFGNATKQKAGEIVGLTSLFPFLSVITVLCSCGPMTENNYFIYVVQLSNCLWQKI